jgi:hypothetical protein
MIRLYRIVRPESGTDWLIGQFADERHAIDEYNSEVRRAASEGIDDGQPELDFAERGADVEFFLVEQEVTHTEIQRDESTETGRWGLVRSRRHPS